MAPAPVVDPGDGGFQAFRRALRGLLAADHLEVRIRELAAYCRDHCDCTLLLAARQGAVRAAEVVRQLLAFGRKQVLNRTRIVDGKIVLDNGAAYKVLVIPDQLEALTPELASRLRDLVRGGMLLLSPRPAYSLGMRNLEEAMQVFDAAVDDVWGDVPIPAEGRGVGNGRVFSDVPVQHVLDAAGVRPDPQVAVAVLCEGHNVVVGDGSRPR